VEDDTRHQPFRLPIQWVNRPHLDFRGFCGTVASGTVRPGDEVQVASSGKTSRVARIVTMDGDLQSAVAGQAVTLTLTDEIDISRGDLLTKVGASPLYTRHPEAHLVWMSDEPLQPGQLYLVKTATAVTPGRVTRVEYVVDVNTLEQHQESTLGLNGIGVVRLELDRPVSLDPYRENRATGSFILIDRFSNATVAAGMVIAVAPLELRQEPVSLEPKRTGDVRHRVISLSGTSTGGTGVSLVDLTGEWGTLEFELSPGFMEHLDKGNRVLFRLRDLEHLPAVAQVAYEQALSFEFDRTVGGISILLFKRGTAPQLKAYGDDGVDI
jgi:sulfate adenylyltransferase subunit 1